MNFEAQQAIQKELDPRERLIWAGIPKQGVYFQSSDIVMVPLSLLWGGFAIFWEFMAVTGQKSNSGPAGHLFPLFGLPFVIIGLYMIFGRFFYDAKRRSKTFYGLTDQRAIIITGLLGHSIKSLNLATLSDVNLSEKSDMTGTITFGQDNNLAGIFSGNGFPGGQRNMVPKFELIENAKDVYNKLRQLQKPGN